LAQAGLKQRIDKAMCMKIIGVKDAFIHRPPMFCGLNYQF